jgi:hypothetical protein
MPNLIVFKSFVHLFLVILNEMSQYFKTASVIIINTIEDDGDDVIACYISVLFCSLVCTGDIP